MRLVEIKNKYFFKNNNPHGTHTYAVYYDKKHKENRAIALTHLYVKDEKRFQQVKRGNILKQKFKEFDTPTGVKNYFYSRSITGKKINLNDKDITKVYKRYLPKQQSDKIKKFAYKNYNK